MTGANTVPPIPRSKYPADPRQRGIPISLLTGIVLAVSTSLVAVGVFLLVATGVI